MKKILFLFTAFCFLLSACVPTWLQSQAASPAPISEENIQETVAAQVEQTLVSLPSPTILPSNTPVVMTATSVPTQTRTQTVPPAPTLTGTQNPILLTLTATLGTGTVTFTATPHPALSATSTGTPHYQYYGTMPPNLPSGNVTLSNMSKADAYISMQCTTVDGYVTIIEYPLGGSWVETSAPAGHYIYVAWVGGKKFDGSFRLKEYQDLTIRMYKDRVEIK